MPINPNIALGIQPIQQPNMLAQYGQMMALKAAQQETEGYEGVKGAIAGGMDPTDPRMLQYGPRGVAAFKAAGEGRSKQLEAAEKSLTLTGQIAGYVRDNPTPENFTSAIGTMVQNGVLTTQQAQRVIADAGNDPAKIKTYAERAASDAIKEADKLTARTRIQTANIGAGPAYQRNAMLQAQWQHSIDNPKMTPLAGEKIDAKGNKVPAYFGYDPTTNTMEEVRMPTVTVGPLTTIDPNAPANNLAPPNVNALTAPPTAGAPTSPVMRSPALTAPSAAAPTAAMPSATSPTSVSGGVRFGPKSTSDSLTEAQGKATNFSIRAKQAHEVLNTIGEDGKVQPGLIKRGAEAIPFIGEGLGTALNVTQSAAQQQVEQAQRNFVNAVLRQESGAAINEGEFNNAKKQYFPQPGDSKEVIEQKRLNREAAIKGFDIAAGPGAKQATPPSTAPKRISSMDEYNSLPSGATYIDPEGTTRRKK
jgi:hypothetical protein